MIVSISFTKFKNSQKETIELINKTNAEYLHIDLMDGKFVPITQQTPEVIEELYKNINKTLDVHIMAEDPLSYLPYFKKLNLEYFVFHLEATTNIESLISEVKKAGLKVGLAIKIETDVKYLNPYLSLLDQILIMSCEVGYGGTPFKEEAIAKISYLKEQKEKNNYHYLINVDGGININTVDKVKKAGVDMVVSGSYICMSDDYQDAVDSLR